jgi:tRNA(fMet)-specific endonuclease VapC
VAVTPVWSLDTNILSEAVKSAPNKTILENLARYENELAISSVVLHELRFGWLSMPEGKRRDAIGRFLIDVVGALPILPYDANAANIHAQIRIECAKRGKTLPFADGQIAAITIANGATLVTRNVKDFRSIEGLRLVDWNEE